MDKVLHLIGCGQRGGSAIATVYFLLTCRGCLIPVLFDTPTFRNVTPVDMCKTCIKDEEGWAGDSEGGGAGQHTDDTSHTSLVWAHAAGYSPTLPCVSLGSHSSAQLKP